MVKTVLHILKTTKKLKYKSMNNNSLKQILTQVSKGKINIETALSILDNNNSSAKFTSFYRP